MSTPKAEGVIAAELVAARTEGRSLAGFPGAIPASMAQAYRIQDLAMSLWPDSLVGSADDPDRLVGPIWRKQCHRGADHRSTVEVEIFTSGFAAVEAELVLRLGQDLPDHDRVSWTAEEAADLVQDLLVGIEVASSPIPDINSLGPTVIAADFGNNNGLVLGPALAEGAQQALTQLSCIVDGRLVGEGSADSLPGGIFQGLATALDVLAGRGQPVRAGMVFATGAITGIHPIGPGQHCRVDVRDGPSVEIITRPYGSGA
jgi:2-keto-4-pentenoate hydratase